MIDLTITDDVAHVVLNAPGFAAFQQKRPPQFTGK